jgi:hypothetical protein
VSDLTEWYPHLQYYDVQTLEYRYISKLPMKNEQGDSYIPPKLLFAGVYKKKRDRNFQDYSSSFFLAVPSNYISWTSSWLNQEA